MEIALYRVLLEAESCEGQKNARDNSRVGIVCTFLPYISHSVLWKALLWLKVSPADEFRHRQILGARKSNCASERRTSISQQRMTGLFYRSWRCRMGRMRTKLSFPSPLPVTKWSLAIDSISSAYQIYRGIFILYPTQEGDRDGAGNISVRNRLFTTARLEPAYQASCGCD
jgi:hypothetical protein